MAFAKSLDPDVAKKEGPHLRSEVFDTQILYISKGWVGNNDFLQFFKEITEQAELLYATTAETVSL